jgi:hypothetical protein
MGDEACGAEDPISPRWDRAPKGYPVRGHGGKRGRTFPYQ